MDQGKPLRVAVVGVGSFGRNHLRVCAQSANVELVAVVDEQPERAAQAAAEYGCLALGSAEELAGLVDAAIVATPTAAHSQVGCMLLAAGIDVLVEKPLASSAVEAQALVDAAERHGRILQVGHLERFNPAVEILQARGIHPLFFEIHRLSVFTPRSLDVDVVLDLMIHDLELVLALVGFAPEEVRAAGIRILSSKVDIANVRLQFPGGCVANLTASRASTEQVRKLRVFAPGEYLSLDYSRQELTAVTVDRQRQIGFAKIPVVRDEPLRREIEDFVACVRLRRLPRVSGRTGLAALRLALDILDKIEEHAGVVASSLAPTASQSR